MVIEEKDFNEIYALVKDHLKYGASTIFYLPGNGIKKESLTFCYGPEDVALFYHHHPYDADWYHSIRADSLSKIMDKIEQGELQAKTLMEGSTGRQFIDLGLMVKENELIDHLHYKMKNADWYYDYSDDFRVWQKGDAEIEDIKKDLKELSQTQEGMEVANRLWQLYVPPYSVNKPHYLTIGRQFMGESVIAIKETQQAQSQIKEVTQNQSNKQVQTQKQSHKQAKRQTKKRKIR